MPNASFVFGFPTRNPSLTRHYRLVFQIPSENSIKEIRVRYANILTLLSIFKSTVNID